MHSEDFDDSIFSGRLDEPLSVGREAHDHGRSMPQEVRASSMAAVMPPS